MHEIYKIEISAVPLLSVLLNGIFGSFFRQFLNVNGCSSACRFGERKETFYLYNIDSTLPEKF